MSLAATFKPGMTTTVDPTEVSPASNAPLTTSQKQLKAFIDRRHPDYHAKAKHWEFLAATYEGGRGWFEENIFRYIKEGDREYGDRVSRAYRFNHTREVVDLINKYLFRQNITRNTTDAPPAVKAFWERATKQGLPMKELSKQMSKAASLGGRIGVVIDNPAGPVPANRAEEKRLGHQPYAYIVSPIQILDYAWDERGDLAWIKLLEISRDDKDPLLSSGVEKRQYRLWTKTNWTLFEEVKEGNKRVVKVVDSAEHALGMVPVVLVDHIISEDKYSAPAMVDDIAYLDRAVANYLSNLDAIIQDQSFSQLAMPAQNLLPGEESAEKVKEMGTKRIFIYDGENGGRPEFLSPDVKQAQLIMDTVVKIIGEIYHSVGMAGERTKQDNSQGIDNSSGVAKAYDFERVNALLAAKADSLEVAENKILRIVAAWAGQTAQLNKLKTPLVQYPDDFDTRGLYDEFDIAGRLMLTAAPEGVRREQMRLVIKKLFPGLGAADLAKLEAELDDWPPEEPTLEAGDSKPASDAKAGAKRTATKQTEKNPKKPGQGSVQDE